MELSIGSHTMMSILCSACQAVVLTCACCFGCLQISHVIAPATLAVYALNLSHITYLDTATLLFGYFLAEKVHGGAAHLAPLPTNHSPHTCQHLACCAHDLL